MFVLAKADIRAMLRTWDSNQARKNYGLNHSRSENKGLGWE